MVLLAKLSNNNLTKFKNLSTKKLKTDTYDKNFFKYYNNENFFSKIILKRFVKLFVYDDKIIGYMWYNIPFENPVKVWSLYVEPNYIELLDDTILSDFDNLSLFYEETDDELNNNLLEKLGFIQYNRSYLMMLTILDNTEKDFYYIDEKELLKIFKDKYNSRDNDITITFKPFIIGEDEQLRCNLQNNIFADKERVAIDVDDIENDIKQDYYIEDLAFFININDISIGYGQVIYNREMNTVVNFGIIKEFRRFGLGKLLLNYIIRRCKEKEIDKLYIRVNENNTAAYNLYKSVGFDNKFAIRNWQRNKSNS